MVSRRHSRNTASTIGRPMFPGPVQRGCSPREDRALPRSQGEDAYRQGEPNIGRLSISGGARSVLNVAPSRARADDGSRRGRAYRLAIAGPDEGVWL
jgi:hypothetical protein